MAEKKYLILQEEFPIQNSDLKAFEKANNIVLPNDYREFLLKYNGGIPVPDCPKTKMENLMLPIERLNSLQDIEFNMAFDSKEYDQYVKEDIEDNELNVEQKKLVFIGYTERGYIHLYCGEEDFGRIYYSDYSGGVGFEKTGLESFTQMLESLGSFYEDMEVDIDPAKFVNWQSEKVFNFGINPYGSEEKKRKTFERFKEVLAYYGDPNKVHERKEMDVVMGYLNHPFILKYLIRNGAKLPTEIKCIHNLESLQFLVEHGTNIDGLLNTTRNIDVVKYLLEEGKQDLNKSIDGIFPLVSYTNIGHGSDRDRFHKYKFVRAVLDLGYDVDLEIKDDKGQRVRDKIEILKENYKTMVEK